MPPASGLTRGLSTYHRTRLSLDGTNYAQIPPPRTRLRRSAHLPYGMVSEGWADLTSRESIRRPAMAAMIDQQGGEPSLAQPKRRRSLRATFSPHSFHVPKTRRQKKIDKAIPLNAVGRSPLSAITEFSDPNTRDVSPVTGAVELPTEVTPMNTPPKHEDGIKPARPMSPQWPLRVDKSRPQGVIPIVTQFGDDSDSTLMRTKSTGHSIGPNRPSLGQRSISMASAISVAPDDPLPPLPTIVTSRYPERNNSKVRSSVASTDTVSSSMLGTGIFSLSHDGTDQTDCTMDSPWIALSPSLLQEYESRPGSWGPTAVTMGTPPGTKTSRGIRNGAMGIGSFRASIGDPLSRITSTNQALATRQYEHSNGLIGTALTTVNTSVWDPGLPGRGTSFHKSLSPSLLAPVDQYGLHYSDGRPMARHSMYEQHTGLGKISFNPDVLQDLSCTGISRISRDSQPRPASVGTSNPFQWDQNVLSRVRNVNIHRSPSSQRHGHKRQNCIRISNLPSVDMGQRASKLPQMAEEDEQPETPTKSSSKIQGLSLIRQDDEDVMYKSEPAGGPPSSSPFRNRPILNPTSHPRRAPYSRASCTRSSGSPRPDSDIFSTFPYEPKTPNIFVSTSLDRQWPLSPTAMNNVKLNSGPSEALKPISEPYDPESPILPSPTLLSGTIFPRKSNLYGPRDLPSRARSGRGSRTTSPSPLQRMSRNATAGRATSKQHSGEDLRRSVMTLRGMNSDLNSGTQDRVSKIYRNIANEYAGSLSSVQSRSPSMIGAMGSPSPVHKNDNDNLAPLPLMTEKQLTSTLTTGGSAAVRHSNSRLPIGHSISMVSTAGASIWEDASIRGDSPEPELPFLEQYDQETPETTTKLDVDLEAYENFVGQDRRDRVGESRLVSPQGKGLGLMGLGSKVWGTPASLYDREGFLKE